MCVLLFLIGSVVSADQKDTRDGSDEGVARRKGTGVAKESGADQSFTHAESASAARYNHRINVTTP